jgi:uncharacterized protein (TIGR02996 family)
MNERAAILRAVCDDLAADAPRLVYADWLDDHGRSARAEFVRTQVERARLPGTSPRRVGLFRREQELEAAHRGEWLDGVPEWLKPCRYWRGLLVGCRVGITKLLGSEGAFRRADGEVIELIAEGSVESVRRLAACPALEIIFGLNMADCGIDDEAAFALADSPHLEHLCWLDLRRNGLSPRAERQLRARFGDRVKLASIPPNV